MKNKINPEKNKTSNLQHSQEIPNQKSAKIIVIGASHAGISFCDQLRKKGYKGELTIIEKRRGAPMERPPLSKAFLLEPDDDIKPVYLLKRAKWYKEQAVTLRHGNAVNKIDPYSRTVTLDNNDVLDFDLIVIATGAIPRNLEDAEGISKSFVLRQPDDAIKIRHTARGMKSATIIGGGYIGLELAATLRQMGLEISVIEVAERLLARVASPPIARIMTELHLKHGVSIYTGISVQQLHHQDSAYCGITLSDDKRVESDMLIVGIGVAPDSALAVEAGIETESHGSGAILVDDSMQTNIPNVFAIGDVALKRGSSVRIESVHNAQDSATRAVSAIMGTKPPAYEAPRFWSDQYDANLQSVGIVPMEIEEVYQIVRPGSREGGESFWSYHKKQLLAVETIRDIENFMLGARCLNNNISPDPDLIGDPNYNPMSSAGPV